MIKLSLDWREVLWWMQGGMAGSHLRWSVYEDMVNKVWPQCSEQERRNIWLIMRRDLGDYWRPDGWNGHSRMTEPGEGDWRIETGIHDIKPWMMFRQVLARFDPDNQYEVTMRVKDSKALDGTLQFTPQWVIIKMPSALTRSKFPNKPKTLVVRAYKWENEYRIDWDRRCDENSIVSTEKMIIPDDGTM